MPRFWMRDRRDSVDRLLRESRPQPRDEYLATMLARLESERRRLFRPRTLGRRVLLAAVVTALAFGAAVAAGGVQSASSGLTGLVNVAKKSIGSPATSSGHESNNARGKDHSAGTTTTGSEGTGKTPTGGNTTTTGSGNGATGANVEQHGNGNTDNTTGYGKSENAGEDPAEHQYSVAVCHHTHSATNPWVEIHVPPEVAARFVAHFDPWDFIVTRSHQCPAKHS
jgi:hypothetical protein